MGGHVNSALSVRNWLPSSGKRTTLVLMAEVEKVMCAGMRDRHFVNHSRCCYANCRLLVRAIFAGPHSEDMLAGGGPSRQRE